MECPGSPHRAGCERWPACVFPHFYPCADSTPPKIPDFWMSPESSLALPLGTSEHLWWHWEATHSFASFTSLPAPSSTAHTCYSFGTDPFPPPVKPKVSTLIQTRITSLQARPEHPSFLNLPGDANISQQPELRHPTRGAGLCVIHLCSPGTSQGTTSWHVFAQ